MFPLIIPWLLLFLSTIAVVLFLRKKWKPLILLILIIIGINIRYECFPFRLSKISEENSCCIRIMSFNISATKHDMYSKASQLSAIILQYDPDVVFLTELKGKYKPVFDSLLHENLPFSSYTRQYSHCFYSKMKLRGWRKLYKEGITHLGVFTCIMPVERDSIVLYGCHFASNNYTSDNLYITPDSINNHRDLRQYGLDIQRASKLRSIEASVVKEEMMGTIYPVLLMGDLNDVSGSAAIETLKEAGLSDAWWNCGFGYGATIHNPLPYRIDHIMFTNHLKLKHIEVVDSKGLSDHDALYAEFILHE
jgi:endonuclease/exonuclease/phosphatase (EEP) superfamily protein YafD